MVFDDKLLWGYIFSKWPDCRWHSLCEGLLQVCKVKKKAHSRNDDGLYATDEVDQNVVCNWLRASLLTWRCDSDTV